MLMGIELKNFKSFVDLSVDFRESKTKAKKVVAVYGENGSGKSNLMGIFEFMKTSTITVDSMHKLADIQGRITVEYCDPNSLAQLFKYLEQTDLQAVARGKRTVNEAGNLSLKVDFVIDKEVGSYRMVFDDKNHLIEEELIFRLKERLGTHFKVTKTENQPITWLLSQSIFFSKKISNELLAEVEKSWGKHSFIAILNYYQTAVNSDYLGKHISPNLCQAITELEKLITSGDQVFVGAINNKLLGDLASGEVPKVDEIKIKLTEEGLYTYFKSLYTDIKDVFYKVNEKEKNMLTYQLFFKKNIFNDLKDISINDESKGTKALLTLFPLLIEAVAGGTVIIDKIDNDIHDILMSSILESIQAEIKGQLIFSTHDTYLLEKLASKSAYFINVDHLGNKTINNINDYKNLYTSTNTKRQKQYLAGSYNGVPYPVALDFYEIIEELNQCIHRVSRLFMVKVSTISFNLLNRTCACQLSLKLKRKGEVAFKLTP